MTKLNACPNCGSEPDIVSACSTSFVRCNACDHGLSVKSKSASGAMNAWNAATGEQSVKTLRDEFAIAVLNGAIAANANRRPASYDDLAADCYSVADFMLKERGK